MVPSFFCPLCLMKNWYIEELHTFGLPNCSVAVEKYFILQHGLLLLIDMRLLTILLYFYYFKFITNLFGLLNNDDIVYCEFLKV